MVEWEFDPEMKYSFFFIVTLHQNLIVSYVSQNQNQILTRYTTQIELSYAIYVSLPLENF